MWSHCVVLPAPIFDLLPCIGEVHEPVLATAFHPYDGVEALGIGVVRRLAGTAEVQDDSIAVGPEIEFLRGKLRALIHPDRFRIPVQVSARIEGRDHFHRRRRAADPHDWVNQTPGVDHRQQPEPLAVEGLVEHRVHRPDLVRSGRVAAIASELCHDPAPWWLQPHLEPFEIVQPSDPLHVYLPALAPQQDVEAPVPIAHMRFCQLSNELSQYIRRWPVMNVVILRARRRNRAAGSAERYPEHRLHEVDHLATPRRG